MSPTLPLISSSANLSSEPQLVLDRRIVKRNNAPVTQLLIKWTNSSDDDATWEDYTLIKRRFPQFILEDQELLKGGGMSRPRSEGAELGVAVGSFESVNWLIEGDGERRAAGKTNGQEGSISKRWDPLVRVNETQSYVSLTLGPNEAIRDCAIGPTLQKKDSNTRPLGGS